MDVVHPLLELQRSRKISFRVAMEYAPTRNMIRASDVVVFCRNTSPQHAQALRTVLDQKKPFIYDLDDNFFEISTETPVGRYHRAEPQIRTLETYLSSASLVRVYSSRVEQIVKKYNPQVALVIPPIKWSFIRPRPLRLEGEPIRIVYATSQQEDPLEEIFRPALVEILKKYTGKVQMVFWGIRPEGYDDFKCVEYWPFTANYNRFLERFSSYGFDIGLAPLQNTPFHLSKTNAKFRDYAACKIAGVYSDVPVYSNCVENGRTGLLVANTPADWFAAISRLIEDAPFRNQIAEQAYLKAQTDYSETSFNLVWLEQIQTLLNSPLPSASVSEISSGLTGSAYDYYWKKISEKSPVELGKIFITRLQNSWNLIKINQFKRI